MRIRNLFYLGWNIVQKPFFGRLSLRARVHPLARFIGRKQIFIGYKSIIGPHAWLSNGEWIEPSFYPEIFSQPTFLFSSISREKANARKSSITIGDYSWIAPYAFLLTYGGSIEIGAHSTVNSFCVLHGHGGLKIGDGVRIAAGTSIIAANHIFVDSKVPIYQQGLEWKGICIENNVWIGANCTILDGVTIGEGTVVAAGAVVTENVAPYSIVGGVPARLITKR